MLAAASNGKLLNESESETVHFVVKKSLLRRCLNRVLSVIVSSAPGATTVRPMLHRCRGVKIGREVFIGDDVYLDNEYPESIEIHDRVQISIRAVVVAHTRGPGKVIIGAGAFIGPHAVVACSGGTVLTIGEGAVVSAGCVVTRSVPPRMVLAPAAPRGVGWAAVPFTTARSMKEFWGGLAPLQPGARPGDSTPETE